MDKQYRSILFVISVVFFLLIPNSAFTKSATFQREYTYQASEADSKLSCRAIALEQVKRLLLEELGTYLEVETEVRDFQLTKDKITTLTAGIVQTRIVAERWDGKEYWLKASIIADPDKVLKSIEALRRERNQVKDLEEARKRAQHALSKVQRLRKELAFLKGMVGERRQRQYNEAVKELKATDWFERGIAFYTSENYKDAIKAFTMVINLRPKEKIAYNNRGNAYDEKGQHDKAIADFTKALELDPGYSDAYYNRGLSYYDKGLYDRALEDFTKTLELDPISADAYYHRGLTYYAKGLYDRALEDFTKTLELEPISEVYKIRGDVYEKKGQYDKAITDYNKALELDPILAVAYNNRGNVYWSKGQYDKAIEDYNKALELDPILAVAYFNRANVYANKGQYDKAIADYTKALELRPGYVDDYFKRGNAYYNKGQHDKAIADFTKALELRPSSVGAHNSLSWLLATCPNAELRDGNRAVKLARKVLELTQGREGYLYLDTLAAALAESGEFENAVKVQQQAISLLKEKGGSYLEHYLEDYLKRLKSYKAGKPWRE
jgi:tetratricopeptide (TPR) repeat protein